MKYLCIKKQTLSILSLCQVAGTLAFAPYANVEIVQKQQFQLSSTRISEDGIKIDIAHAHDCADNFGKCSIDEMEAMKDGKRINLFPKNINIIMCYVSFRMPLLSRC